MKHIQKGLLNKFKSIADNIYHATFIFQKHTKFAKYCVILMKSPTVTPNLFDFDMIYWSIWINVIYKPQGEKIAPK